MSSAGIREEPESAQIAQRVVKKSDFQRNRGGGGGGGGGGPRKDECAEGEAEWSRSWVKIIDRSFLYWRSFLLFSFFLLFLFFNIFIHLHTCNRCESVVVIVCMVLGWIVVQQHVPHLGLCTRTACACDHSAVGYTASSAEDCCEEEGCVFGVNTRG